MAITTVESKLFPVRRDGQIASASSGAIGGFASSVTTGGSGVSDHNLLSGLQGGDSSGDYYHLDVTQYAAIQNMVSITGTPVDNQVAIFSAVSTLEGSANLTFDGSTLALTGNLTATKATFTTGVGNGIWFGDGDTGFYEPSDDTLRLACAGTYYRFTASYMLTNSGAAFALKTNTASATVPTLIPHAASLNTGIGGVSDTISLICNSTEIVHVNSVGIGLGLASTDSKVRARSTTPSVSGVFGEAVVTANLGIGIGVDAESVGVNTGWNYGLYAGAKNGNYNYGVYIENDWPPVGDNNYSLYSLSPAKSYFAGEVLLNSDLRSPTFVSGFSGSGWKLESTDPQLTVDYLTVRKSMYIYEMIINQIRAINGGLWISDSAKITATEAYPPLGGWKCWIDTDGGNIGIPFYVGDLVRCQKWTGRDVRYYTAEVLTIEESQEYFVLIVRDGTDNPAVGDEIVRTGSTDSEGGRMGSIYLTASDTNAPYIEVLDDVDEPTFTIDNIKVRLGNLTGITDADFGALSTFGLYSQDAYLKGSIIATAGLIGGWSISSSALYKDGAGASTSSGMSPSDYPFYAGATYTNRASAKFRVTPAGDLTAVGSVVLGSSTGEVDLGADINRGNVNCWSGIMFHSYLQWLPYRIQDTVYLDTIAYHVYVADISADKTLYLPEESNLEDNGQTIVLINPTSRNWTIHGQGIPIVRAGVQNTSIVLTEYQSITLMKLDIGLFHDDLWYEISNSN